MDGLEIEGEDLKLPLTLISGRKEGKTLLISAGIHGAEYIGVQTLLEISGEIDPGHAVRKCNLSSHGKSVGI